MTTSFYNDVLPFFSNDGRGPQFIHFNYKGNEYESSINTENNIDTIIGEPIFQIMITKNYISKPDGEQENDIHHDFVDFIINTALFHRNIDKPSTNVVDIMKNVNIVEAELNKLNDEVYKKCFNYVNTYIKTIKMPDFKDIKLLQELIKLNKDELPEIFKEISLLLIDAFEVYFKNESKDYVLNIILPAIHIGIANTVATPFDDKTFKQILIKNLINYITIIVKTTVPKASTIPSPSYVLDKVKQLKDLEKNARKFYLSNFVILQKHSDGRESLFVDFDKIDNPALNLRLNFKKSPSNKLRTVFSNSLPLVPSVCKKLYYTNDRGNVNSISLSNLSKNDRMNILRNIYDHVYSSGNMFKLVYLNHKEQTINVASQPIQNNFKVNYGKLISSIVNSYDSYKYSTKTFDNFDDLFVDMSTDIVYNKDVNGIFRQVDANTKIYYDMAKLSLDADSNCYGTHINDPSADCNVANILLNNTPENLERNLAVISNESLFDVAKSDIQNMNPDIMKNIVNTFGFIIRKESDGVYRPMAFNEWIKSSRVSENIKKVITNNNKLKIYLSEILNILRNNPVLFNKNNPLPNPSHSNIGLNLFHSPVNMERPKRNLNLGILMKNNIQNVELPLFLNLQNVGFQTGGGIINENNSDKIKKMFNQLFMQLEHNGKELKKEDKERIDKVIENAVKLENQLNQMYEQIQLYSNLQEMLKDSNVIDPVDLSEIHDITTNKTRLEETMQKIRERIQKNLVTQQKVFQTLYLIHDPIIRLISFP